MQCPLLLIGPDGALQWLNDPARRLLVAGAASLDQALERDDADALSGAAVAGQPLRLVVRVARRPDLPSLQAALQPLGGGGALVTLTPPESDVTVSGLPGLATFTRRLARSIRRARIDGTYLFAVLLVELDGSALVKNTLGRASGDALVREAARRLQESLRPADEVAHLVGDQFAVLVDRIASTESVLEVAGRVQQALLRPLRLDGHEVSARAAIGVALSATRYETAEDVLRDAAVALGRAKSAGTGRPEIYDPLMRERALVRLRLESDLRRAVERGEFVLHYQPILDLEAGTPYGFEALMRWQHPTRGLLEPSDFIRLAEETGLIVPMVNGVFLDACSVACGWRRRFGPLSLSMNFTAMHFHDAAVVDTVQRALSASGLEPEGLVVEITETALVTDFAPVAAALAELREHGVRVHLDDFGTGYSSLSYLHNLPIDALKIDRSFVSRLEHGASAAVLVKAILDLAASLGKRAIAEGVETEAQSARLRALGCRLVQGYLYGRPMPRADAERWLERPPGLG